MALTIYYTNVTWSYNRQTLLKLQWGGPWFLKHSRSEVSNSKWSAGHINHKTSSLGAKSSKCYSLIHKISEIIEYMMAYERF
jgi:hypothetical protein